MKPLVSAIITTFQGEDWIRATVASALAQTYSPLEVIVCDDGSTDTTPQLLSSFGSRITVVSQPNAGVSLARNAAVSASRGELLAFLDHDDLWEPNKIEAQVERYSADPSVGLLFADSWIIDGEGRRHGRRGRFHSASEGEIYEALALRNFVPVESLMVPRRVFDAVGGFDPTWKYLEDHDLCLRIAARWRAAYVDAPLASYRIHAHNLSHRRAPMLREWAALLERTIQGPPPVTPEIRTRLSAERGRRLGDAAWHALRDLDAAASRETLAQGGTLIPWRLRARVRVFGAMLRCLPPGLRPALVGLLPRHRYYGITAN